MYDINNKYGKEKNAKYAQNNFIVRHDNMHIVDIDISNKNILLKMEKIIDASIIVISILILALTIFNSSIGAFLIISENPIFILPLILDTLFATLFTLIVISVKKIPISQLNY